MTMENLTRGFQVFCGVATLILSIPVLAVAAVIWLIVACFDSSENW